MYIQLNECIIIYLITIKTVLLLYIGTIFDQLISANISIYINYLMFRNLMKMIFILLANLLNFINCLFNLFVIFYLTEINCCWLMKYLLIFNIVKF